MSRVEDLVRFYSILDALAERQGRASPFADCHGRLEWPRRGVYFFLEPDEQRSVSGVGLRVVRVGTHALARTSRATLWQRLAQHRGTTNGSGNHRGSIFRLLVGGAALAREGMGVPSWGVGGSRGAAAQRLDVSRESLAAREAPVERRVSEFLGAMRLIVLGIDDDPGPNSLRGYVERNAIALLSNFQRPQVDAPSADWLGSSSPREKVRGSGLWNQDHVDVTHEPGFLDVLAGLVNGEPTAARSVPGAAPTQRSSRPAPTSTGPFAGLTLAHVRAAAARIDREGVPPRRAARSTVALLGGREYPAKYLLGLAVEKATGQPLDSESYTGGKATAVVLADLGIDVRHGQTIVRGRTQGTTARPPSVMRSSSSVAKKPVELPSLVVATAAVRGTVSRTPANNRKRERLLRDIVDHLDRDGSPLGALVLPGGFFCLQQHVGHRPHPDRVEAILGAPFAPALLAAASALNNQHQGSLLVVGIDSVGRKSEGGDQFCVALNPEGVVGLARKVFPVRGGEGLIVSANDFGDPSRVVPMPGGHKALLCACYDGFGISSADEKASLVQRLRVGDRVVSRGDRAFRRHLASGVARQTELQRTATVALIAIHGFRDGGTSTMWQRHGIASASAALGGGFVAAGAHFAPLPSSANRQTLCSLRVPRAHLEGEPRRRRACQQMPVTSLEKRRYLLRWFSVDSDHRDDG